MNNSPHLLSIKSINVEEKKKSPLLFSDKTKILVQTFTLQNKIIKYCN